MKRIVLFLVFILCFPIIQSTQENNSTKQYFNVVKDGEYFIKVRAVKIVLPTEIKEKDIAEEVKEEVKSSEEKALEHLDTAESEAIEEIKSFGIMSIEEKFIKQIRLLKEKKVSEIIDIWRRSIEKIKTIEEKKVIKIRKSKKEIIEEIFESKKDIKNEAKEEKKSLIEKYFRRIEEEIKSIEEKAKKKIENIRINRIPDIRYVEDWTIKEINNIKQKAIEERRIIVRRYLEELKDLGRLPKELSLTILQQLREKMPVFRVSQKGKIDEKIENLWLTQDLEAREIEGRLDCLENFELDFLPEKPLNFIIFPSFRIDYCIFDNRGKQNNLAFYFNIDSNRDGIADLLAVTEENNLERDSFLDIQFGKDGYNRPFKLRNKKYLIERELGLKATDDWYYNCENASFTYDFQQKKNVIKAHFEGKGFCDVILRRRFSQLDLQKHPFLSVDYEVFEGQIPWVYLGLKIDTTGNGRPNKIINSPKKKEASGELIFNAYEIVKKHFPREKESFLVEVYIHMAKEAEFEDNSNNSSVIYLKKFSSFKYIAPTFINSKGEQEEKELVYIIPKKAEKKDGPRERSSVEIDLKSHITQANQHDVANYNILSGKISIKDQDKQNRISNLKLLIKKVYFSQPRDLIECFRFLEKRIKIIKQTISGIKQTISRKIEREKTIEKIIVSEDVEKIKKEDAISIKDIPNFLLKMAYPTSRYSSISGALNERKLFFQEIGYKKHFNLSAFKSEKSSDSEGRNPIINSWKIINQNCDFIAQRKNNSVDFKIKFKGKSVENSFLKLKKQISLNLNKFNILKIDTEKIPIGGEIICKLFINVEGKKQEISFGLERAKEYYLLKNSPKKKAILSEVILLLKPKGKISTYELDFQLKSISFYSYKQGNILNYLKNTYVKGSQSTDSINIDYDEVESDGVEFFDFYEEKKQNLVFTFHKSETNKNQIKISHLFEPDILIRRWNNFEFECFVDYPENLEISLQFLIDLSEDRKVDKRIKYRPKLIKKNNGNTRLVSLNFSIFERINSFWRYYPEAKLIGVEIYGNKKEKVNSFLKSTKEDNLFLISNLRLSKEEYEDTIYNEILTLPLVEVDGKEYRLEQWESFDESMLIQALTEGSWFILGRTQLQKGRHELKMLKHPWLKAEIVEITE